MKEVLGENCPPTDTQNRYLSPRKIIINGNRVGLQAEFAVRTDSHQSHGVVVGFAVNQH